MNDKFEITETINRYFAALDGKRHEDEGEKRDQRQRDHQSERAAQQIVDCNPRRGALGHRCRSKDMARPCEETGGPSHDGDSRARRASREGPPCCERGPIVAHRRPPRSGSLAQGGTLPPNRGGARGRQRSGVLARRGARRGLGQEPLRLPARQFASIPLLKSPLHRRACLPSPGRRRAEHREGGAPRARAVLTRDRSRDDARRTAPATASRMTPSSVAKVSTM